MLSKFIYLIQAFSLSIFSLYYIDSSAENVSLSMLSR